MFEENSPVPLQSSPPVYGGEERARAQAEEERARAQAEEERNTCLAGGSSVAGSEERVESADGARAVTLADKEGTAGVAVNGGHASNSGVSAGVAVNGGHFSNRGVSACTASGVVSGACSTSDSSYRMLQARRRRSRQSSRQGAVLSPASSSCYPDPEPVEERPAFSSASELLSLGEDVSRQFVPESPDTGGLDAALSAGVCRLYVDRGDRFVCVRGGRAAVSAVAAPASLACLDSASHLALGVQGAVSALGVFGSGLGAGVALCQALVVAFFWRLGLEPLLPAPLSLTLQLLCSLTSLLAGVSVLDRCDPAGGKVRAPGWLAAGLCLLLTAVAAVSAPLLQCRCGPRLAADVARALLASLVWLLACCCRSVKKDRLLLTLKRRLSLNINTIDGSLHPQLQTTLFP